jgi:PKD repeat protein
MRRSAISGPTKFRPHLPTVNANASVSKVAPGKKDTFHATGADASPGDSVAFRWNFGDGSSAAGAVVNHAFAKASRHHVTVTATDLDGFTAGASLTITVPAVTELSIKPSRFRSSHGARITYMASQRAATTFRVLRAKTGKLVGKLTHKSHAGKNHFHFAARLKGHALKSGRYRLVAVPRNAAGIGRPVSVKFTIAG